MKSKFIRNPHKTKSVRELGAVDTSHLRELVKAIPENFWDAENASKPNNFKEFYVTKHIIFRFVDSLSDCTKYYDTPLWEKWKEKIQPLLDQVTQQYGYTNGEYSRIMLAKLSAGGDIKAHRDGNLAATFPHKIHIPIVTNPKVMFFVNPKEYHFKEGFAYEVNNKEIHFTENLGDEDRIHLIFEFFNPDHVKEYMPHL